MVVGLVVQGGDVQRRKKNRKGRRGGGELGSTWGVGVDSKREMQRTNEQERGFLGTDLAVNACLHVFALLHGH